MRTAEMFAKPPRIKRMHVIDAGLIEGERAARYYCERCETTTGWMLSGLTEQRRGIPCPECNACEDCPPVGYPTDKTRCAECPRRGTQPQPATHGDTDG